MGRSQQRADQLAGQLGTPVGHHRLSLRFATGLPSSESAPAFVLASTRLRNSAGYDFAQGERDVAPHRQADDVCLLVLEALDQAGNIFGEASMVRGAAGHPFGHAVSGQIDGHDSRRSARPDSWSSHSV